jgi:hypothetical protein
MKLYRDVPYSKKGIALKRAVQVQVLRYGIYNTYKLIVMLTVCVVGYDIQSPLY